MSRLNFGILVALIIAIIANIAQAILWSRQMKIESDKYAQEIVQLQASIDAYGPDVTTYTVTTNVKAGDAVTDEIITEKMIAQSYITDQFVTDRSDLTGRIFKIAVNPGTPIMSNMLMDEEITDDVRDHDITLDRITVGMEPGDYIDIRITMPYGDDYIVLSHKRIHEINQNTIKLYMSESDWLTYQGALLDYYLNKDYGCTIYATRYVEPGVQVEAERMYAVPQNIAALIQSDPNVLDKERMADYESWRQSIDELLVIFRDEEDTVDADAGKLAAGRSAFTESIKADYNANRAAKEQEEAEAEQQAEEAEWSSDEEFDFGAEEDTSAETEETTEENTEEAPQ